MKRKISWSFVLIVLFQQTGYACDLCKKNQPKMLENITHGTGPTGTVDYVIIWSSAIIVGLALFYSMKYLIWPRETNPDHIKNSILNNDF